MKVLVTGAHGFVGSRVMQAFPGAMPCPSLRGASEEKIRAIIADAEPDIIINTAAISDIEACERDPEASYAANVSLPVMLARQSSGARLISFSTDQVYGGSEGDGPYAEDCRLFPVNTYARHKLEAERRVLDICPDAAMLRASWMYDLPEPTDTKKTNFLTIVIKAALTRAELCFSDRERRGITYVREVAEKLPQLTGLPGGVYNFGSENNLSMLETAKSLLAALGADSSILRASPGRHNLQMDCGRLSALGIIFESTEDGLRRCLADYGLGI